MHGCGGLRSAGFWAEAPVSLHVGLSAQGLVEYTALPTHTHRDAGERNHLPSYLYFGVSLLTIVHLYLNTELFGFSFLSKNYKYMHYIFMLKISET